MIRKGWSIPKIPASIDFNISFMPFPHRPSTIPPFLALCSWTSLFLSSLSICLSLADIICLSLLSIYLSLSLGAVFFGESMFSSVDNASKVCLYYLCEYLKSHNCSMIDCQQQTTHLMSLGAMVIERSLFEKLLVESQSKTEQLPVCSWEKRYYFKIKRYE